MAPTYKDLTGDLALQLACRCAWSTYVRVCTREKESVAAWCRCGRGHKPCPDRYTLHVTHYTGGPIPSRNSRAPLRAGQRERRHSEFSRLSPRPRSRRCYRRRGSAGAVNTSYSEHGREHIMREIRRSFFLSLSKKKKNSCRLLPIFCN